MNKRSPVVIVFVLFLSISISAQTGWQMQPIPVQTRWAKEVSPTNALPAYPRPQMVRPTWTNLNGLWDYAITSKDATMPNAWSGKILVPYPIESALSGVKKALQPTDNLWYHLMLPSIALKTGERALLHFGAVDWQTTVYLNGDSIGRHSGGYTAFTFDITKQLHADNNDLVIRVFDPTDQGIGPHGKQTLNPQNIFYTPTSGIWQTVWIEVVPADYIHELRLTPDIDRQELKATIAVPAGYSVELMATANDASVSTVKGKASRGEAHLVLPVKNPHLWSPGDPFLYRLTVRLKKGNQVIDEVASYFGMRKISVAKDDQGIERICLNNKPYYNLGTLDQGFWPDGLYTAPTDDALAFDIKAIKAMGFNTIRKHIKVEPARWYYYADSLGMLVWQDMVNPDFELRPGAKEEFEKESADILHQLYNHPAITTWVLFNERWGQYDQARLTNWIKATDPSRIVNGHTGEMLYVNEKLRAPADSPYIHADMTDVHAYPDPMMPLHLTGKAQVLGEFGGVGVFIPDHQWNNSAAWGYIDEKASGFAAKYAIMNVHLELLEKQGLSGSIYTQPFDVEGEQNGLMTYDREVVKIPFETLRKIHARLNPDMGHLPDVTALNADVTEPGMVYARIYQQFIDGRHDADFLKRLAIMATQVGDKQGSIEAGSAYAGLLKLPLSDDDIHFVAEHTVSSKDKGFALMMQDSVDFVRVMGEKDYIWAVMHMILRGEMQPLLDKEKPDWAAIADKVKPYGAIGEEMYLRSETVYYFNGQDWSHFVPAAKQYLSKYGNDLKPEEKQMFENSLKEHGGS
jgi:Glycosyl hydrolases family 2/Glycosyl hydrolases family 2, sugar binding domain/Glycosyl hydrolases family 2, TIM barrel domain